MPADNPLPQTLKSAFPVPMLAFMPVDQDHPLGNTVSRRFPVSDSQITCDQATATSDQMYVSGAVPVRVPLPEVGTNPCAIVFPGGIVHRSA